MCGVDPHLHRLQPVAFPEAFEGEDMGVGGGKAVECGEGRWVVGAHIGEDDAVLFDHRIAGNADVFVHP